LMMMWSLRVMWPSIVEDMVHHWARKALHLVNDVMVGLGGVGDVCHGRDGLESWTTQRNLLP